MIATFCAALFARGALYISLVEHPTRMADITIALRKFRHSYKRTAPWQASTAVILALFEVPNTIIMEQESQARLVRGLLVVEAFFAKPEYARSQQQILARACYDGTLLDRGDGELE